MCVKICLWITSLNWYKHMVRTSLCNVIIQYDFEIFTVKFSSMKMTLWCGQRMVIMTSATGLAKETIIRKLMGWISFLCYHVVGGLPPDAMHDILEGVLQYFVKELLKMFIFEKKKFRLDDLNRRISAFDFGYHNDTNKPAPILAQKLTTNDNSLK